MAEIEKLEFELKKKCGVVDVQANFKEMSDLLLVKFT